MAGTLSLLDAALERWEGWEQGDPFDPGTLDQILAAARNWQTLTNPTDELIERVAKVIQPWIDVDPATEHEWPLAQLHNARQAAQVAVDALSDTAGASRQGDTQ